MVILKKKSFGYKERNEEMRTQFLQELKNIDPQKCVYLDETGIDDNEVPSFAWGPIGERIFDMKQAERTNRYSILATLSNNKIIAPIVFEGTCFRELFETYLETELLPVLVSGTVIIMDNAAFHKGGRIKFLIEQAGCKLLYLPTYSPDLNPIEHHWFRVKTIIKRYFVSPMKDMYDWAIQAFKEIMA